MRTLVALLTVASGQYTIYLPIGPCALVVGTADGKLHRSTLAVPPPRKHLIALK